jgi:hypothetical protein
MKENTNDGYDFLSAESLARQRDARAVEEDWTHPVAHGKSEGPKLHTHQFSDPIADKVRTQTNELTRAYAIIGVLTKKLLAIGDKADPEYSHVVAITQEELVAISSKELKLEVDTASHTIKLKVES